MTTMRTDHVTVPDGTFDLHVWVPDAGHGPGVLLLQEIFGVGPYIRAVAERLAGLGYVVAAPDVFWRIERNWEAGHDEAGLEASMAMMPRFDFALGIADCSAALDRLLALPEVDGRAAVLGFCLGGGLAFGVAAANEPAAAVCYYGSAVAGLLDQAGGVTCPVLFHYGEDDAFIPPEQVEAVRAAFAGRPDVSVVVQPGAKHAFDNHEAPMFYGEEAARAAWALTAAFLAEHVPVT